MAQIFAVIKRDGMKDEEMAYRETEDAANVVAKDWADFDKKNTYLVLPKKIFGLIPEE